MTCVYMQGPYFVQDTCANPRITNGTSWCQLTTPITSLSYFKTEILYFYAKNVGIDGTLNVTSTLTTTYSGTVDSSKTYSLNQSFPVKAGVAYIVEPEVSVSSQGTTVGTNKCLLVLSLPGLEFDYTYDGYQCAGYESLSIVEDVVTTSTGGSSSISATGGTQGIGGSSSTGGT